MAKLLSLASWIAVAIGVFVVSTNHITDTDFWWHLKTGEYIYQNRTIPSTDIYSFTAEGRVWTPHEWLPQLIFFQIYKFFGFSGVIFFTATIATASFLVLGRILIKKKVTATIAQISIFIGAVVVAPFFIPRPQIFYFFLWTILIYVLTEFKKGNIKIVWFLPVLFFLWANVHASVHIILILIGLFILPQLFLVTNHGHNLLKNNSRLYIFTFIGCIAALANYNTYKIYTFFTDVSPYTSKRTIDISEWNSILLDLKSWQTWFVLGFYLFLTILFIIRIKKNGLSKTFYDILVIYPLIIASLISSKFLPITILLASVYFGVNLGDIINSQKINKFIYVKITPILILGLAFLYHFSLGRPLITLYGYFPEKAAQFVLDNKMSGNMYNTYNWGGYLIWKLYPNHKVFIDGRHEMFEPDIGSDFNIVQGGLDNWEKVLDKHNISFLFIPPGEVFPQLANSEKWILVYFDNLSTIFVENEKINEDIIKKYGYRYVKPFTNQPINSEEKIDELIKEYQRALQIDQEIFKANYDLGIIYQNIGDFDMASKYLKKAVEIFPESKNTHYKLFEIYEKIGDEPKAKREYQIWQHLN